MVTPLIIPIVIVAIVGLTGYFVYRFLVFDFMCRRNVNQILQKYNIKKTPSQIIREYYNNKGEQIPHGEVQALEKRYRQNEPEQFLAMYDSVRDSKHDKD